MTAISYVYADLIEISIKTGADYKTIEQVPTEIKEEVREILSKKGIEV